MDIQAKLLLVVEEAAVGVADAEEDEPEAIATNLIIAHLALRKL